jgi:hypothetical protein
MQAWQHWFDMLQTGITNAQVAENPREAGRGTQEA